MKATHKIALAACTLALAASATMATAAFAAPEWYTSATPAAAEWKQAGASITTAVATVSKGNVRLTDAKLGVYVECEDTAEGAVGPGAAGAVTKWTMANCTGPASCAFNVIHPRELAAVSLPWSTSLSDSRGAISDVISGSAESKPGFRLACIVSGIALTDSCTGAVTATNMANVAGGVSETLSGEKLRCSLGGFEGSVGGTQVIEAAKGGKLEVSGKEGPFSKVAKALEVQGTGRLSIEDKGFGSTRVTCNVETTGTIEAGGHGTITSYAVSACELSGSCSALESASAVNLPWKTELYEAAGVIRDRFLSGGSGTPAWSFHCNGGGVRREDLCNLNVTPGLFNGIEGNVAAFFNEGAGAVNCNKDTHEGEGRWEGELRIKHPAGVAEIAVQK